MNLKETSDSFRSDRFRWIHIVLLSLVAAFFGEWILSGVVPRSIFLDSAGRITSVFLVIYTIHRFAIIALRSYKPRFKDVATFAFVLIGSLLLAWMGREVSASLSSYIGNIESGSMYYAIPYAAGGILIQAVLGLQFGFIFALTLAIILGFYYPWNLLIVPYVIATTLVACLAMARYRSRSAYIKAGMSVALISVPFILSAVLIEGTTSNTELMVRLTSGILGGILCSFIVAGIAPVIEYLGGYVTDMSLMEIATLDHPLLKELSIQAPGTWNHSMVMGMMVEAAADSIGANSVLSRVSAYYHDIGKMKKPLYFVENQIRGENRHDKLSPSMSALILRSHVKDGIELAKKYRIPQVIEDMIPQHHGTSLIEFFYDKALKEAEEEGSEVDESLYRYPGPKPQTKEAGILMLADGIEAASRTLQEPTPDRILGLVQKLINKVFASGELDECELTLKDLHAIAKSFNRVLNGIYHQRIAYAEPAEKVNEEEEGKEIQDNDPQRKQKGDGEPRRHKEGGKEDLKRLGI